MTKEINETPINGYTGNLLRVDLTSDKISYEKLSSADLRNFLGGAGLGIKLLYDETPPNTSWSDLENRFIIATGPLNGTAVGGSGCFSVVTRGALSQGLVYTEASGFLGAFLKFCGFDVIVIQGRANKPTYLYVLDNRAELRDASLYAGKDTWETERLIKKEIDKPEHNSSVFSIGPAGENLVKFACLVGDKGHVAAHGGIGAVLGSKNLKAIAVARGKNKVILSDGQTYSKLAKNLYEKAINSPGASVHKWGTMGPDSAAAARMKVSRLPIKNQTTNLWAGGDKFSEETIRALPYFQLQRSACWACRFDHCHYLKITEGPYAGYEGEEPDYELWTGFGPLIGNEDWRGAAVLSNEADRLGIDGNESAWLVAWIMECYETGIFNAAMLDGLEMNWGNVDASLQLLRKVAHREGVGDIFANGVRQAAVHFGGDAQKLAVYTGKGNTPRMHDHRASWPMILDTATSDRGRDMDAVQVISSATQVGLPSELNLFSAEGASAVLAKARGRNTIADSLVVCRFNGTGSSDKEWSELVNAATGWNLTAEEMAQISRRIINLARLFNVKHGLTPEMEFPSAKYGSAPSDGVNQGKTIIPVWKDALSRYYKLMGWDPETGKPLPETLKDLGLPEN